MELEFPKKIFQNSIMALQQRKEVMDLAFTLVLVTQEVGVVFKGHSHGLNQGARSSSHFAQKVEGI